MREDSVKKNFIFQLLYQFIILVIPLVVSPYLTRILYEKNLGIYSYTYSIAYYFVIIAMLGINKYGQRIIATSKNDNIRLRKNFWSLFTFHSIVSILVILLYFIIFCSISIEDKNIFIIQGIFVLSALFDVTWFFYGLGNFKKVVIRNAIIKVIECALIFALVKTIDDLWIYTLIKASIVLFSQVVMLPVCFKEVKPIKFRLEDLTKHIRPLLVFTIFVVAAMLYTMFDKTMLGILSTKEMVGYYEYATKIIDIPKAFALIIGTIIFPKACSCFAKGELGKVNEYFKASLLVIFFICFGTIFGLSAVSKKLSILYYGETFAICGEIIKWLCPIVLLITLSNLLENMYMIPQNKDGLLSMSILIGGVLNVIFSTILIFFFGVYGAIIGTMTSELIKLIIQFYICRKDVKLRVVFKTILPFLISGIIMFISVFILDKLLKTTYINLLIEVVVGATIYCVLLFIYMKFISKDNLNIKQLLRGTNI